MQPDDTQTHQPDHQLPDDTMTPAEHEAAMPMVAPVPPDAMSDEADDAAGADPGDQDDDLDDEASDEGLE